jgi:hypothetical protein
MYKINAAKITDFTCRWEKFTDLNKYQDCAIGAISLLDVTTGLRTSRAAEHWSSLFLLQRTAY